MAGYQHHWYLDEEGEAQPWPNDKDFLGWAFWLEDADRRIGETFLENGTVRVSTVFLGLNHSFSGETPILFETMIFGGDHSDLTARYHTREEAEQGHQDIVDLLESFYATGKRPAKNGNGRGKNDVPDSG